MPFEAGRVAPKKIAVIGAGISGMGAALSVKGLETGSYHETLYSEAQSGVVVTANLQQSKAFEELLNKSSIPYQTIGVAGGNELLIDSEIHLKVEDLKNSYEGAISVAMSQ